MKLISLSLIALSLSLSNQIAQAAPFVRADNYPAASTPKPTHCGVLLDSAPKVQIPITSEAGNIYCKYDLSGVSNGNHSIKMTHILIDQIWGTLESAESNPLAFVKPAQPSLPAGLQLIP